MKIYVFNTLEITTFDFLQNYFPLKKE